MRINPKFAICNFSILKPGDLNILTHPDKLLLYFNFLAIFNVLVLNVLKEFKIILNLQLL